MAGVGSAGPVVLPGECDGSSSCVSGACLSNPGASCSTDAECGSGACVCGDASCSTTVCAAAGGCGACEYFAGGACVAGVGSGGPVAVPGICDGASRCFSGSCRFADGGTCSLDSECGSGNCVCADAGCAARVCHAVACPSCTYLDAGSCTGRLSSRIGWSDFDGTEPADWWGDVIGTDAFGVSYVTFNTSPGLREFGLRTYSASTGVMLSNAGETNGSASTTSGPDLPGEVYRPTVFTPTFVHHPGDNVLLSGYTRFGVPRRRSLVVVPLDAMSRHDIAPTDQLPRAPLGESNGYVLTETLVMDTTRILDAVVTPAGFRFVVLRSR